MKLSDHLANYLYAYTGGFAAVKDRGKHGDACFCEDQRRPGQALERRHRGLLAGGKAEH
jgi:hypothetical protein